MSATLPAIFRDILDDPGHRLIDEAVADGRTPIGYTCSYVPEALLSVDGLVPIRLRAPGVAGTPMADTYLSSVICPFTRSLLEFTLEDRYDFLGGWVFTSSCDHLRRLCDNLEYLAPPPFLHLIDLPHKTGDAALEWYTREIAELAEALRARFDVDTGPAALTRAIERLNRQREALQSIGDLRRREHPPISGTDFHRLVVACAAAPRNKLEEALAEVARDLEQAAPDTHYRARLMVVGSELDDPDYLEIIESMGGLVVADRFCAGSIPGLEPIPLAEDPLPALAEHTLRSTRCPRMFEQFDRRLGDLLAVIRDYTVDGVIVETLKFCDIWGYESAALISALREAGVPVLRLEREYTRSGEGQLRTRVQAFLESMGK